MDSCRAVDQVAHRLPDEMVADREHCQAVLFQQRALVADVGVGQRLCTSK
jgi:hypothetical protein